MVIYNYMDIGRDEWMSIGYTYVSEEECPICCYSMPVTKLRSRMIKIKQDSDFCAYYKDFNPYYYTIWICPHCGYASDTNHFKEIKEREKDRVAEFLMARQIRIPHTEFRTREQAITAFKLAIYIADLAKAPASRMAGLYLKLAWLYREAEDKENENQLLELALKAYDRALITERFPIGSLTDNAVIYLIGDLHRRLGEIEKATQYLSRIIGDKTARSEYKIYKLARDVWQDMRDEKG